MPVVLDRLPLPNLTWYTIFSIFLMTCSIYYAFIQVILNPQWRVKYMNLGTGEDEFLPSSWTTFSGNEETHICAAVQPVLHDSFSICYNENVWSPSFYIHQGAADDKKEPYLPMGNMTYFFPNYLQNISPHIIPEILLFVVHEPLCIWTLINMAYCVLIVLGTVIQHFIFGELRVSEQQHIKDKFWNFVFYKFIFVFGVMNVQAMGEVILWCSWFSVLGFLHLLAQLCKDRFEYLSFSPTTPKRTHMRLLGLLGIILLVASSCLMISIVVGFHSSINTFAFMAAECILLMVRTLYVICRYSIYLWDISHEGLWEKRGLYIYFTELAFELSDLVIDMVHHIHMLVWGNMFLTMASLVICMQLRLLFYQLQHKVKSHKTYLRVVRLIERYPQVQRHEISFEEETCAICWESVEIGRRLDCGHLFHSSCLMAWLHHDLSCPTCRHKLNPQEENDQKVPGLFATFLPSGIDDEESDSVDNQGPGVGFPSPMAPEGLPGSTGWRYVSWLSSFSVEQNHTQLPRHHQSTSSHLVGSSQLDNLARQVEQMFPDLSYSRILEDLQRTHSLEDTIDNILDHRLVTLPPPMFSQPSTSARSSITEKCPDPTSGEDGQPSFWSEDGSTTRGTPTDAIPFQFPTNDEGTGSHKDDTDSDCDSMEMNVHGSRFSKSPEEREQMLSQRIESLLSVARQKLLAKKLSKEMQSTIAAKSSSSEVSCPCAEEPDEG